MKRLILISAFFTIAGSAFAQNSCSKADPLFKTDHYGVPKDVNKLGSNPEFTFLRHMNSAEQVAAAIRKSGQQNTPAAEHLDGMLKDIGFANGSKDVMASNVSMYYIPSGTVGNMGDGNFNTSYCKLMPDDPNGTKSYKISSGTGCEMYILAACGNAFYPTETKPGTACLTVPVSVISDNREVTLPAAGTATTTDQIFVYYHRKKHKNNERSYASASIPDPNPSKPLLLNTSDNVVGLPVTYKVSVTSQSSTAIVCPEKELEVPTTINVEKQASYTGNYPGKSNAIYKEVSKRAYKKAMRKMTKVHRKQCKVEHVTGVAVR